MKRFGLLILFLLLAIPAFATDKFVSPTGSGTCLSLASPCLYATAYATASPDDRIMLVDGTYTGVNSMIRMNSGRNGTSGHPITVKAINDGRVLIDGQGVRVPLSVTDNWWVVQGINFANSNQDVMQIQGGNGVYQRLGAWNAESTGNWTVISVFYPADQNLIEDFFGFGSGRKIVSVSAGANRTTLRRIWAEWNNSTSTAGPKQTYTIAYDSYNTLCENCIGTRDEDAPPPDYDRFGILSQDHMTYDGTDASLQAHATYLGSIGYVLGSQTVAASNIGLMFGVQSTDFFSFRDSMVYIQPGTHTDITAINAQTYCCGVTASGGNRRFDNVTAIGAVPANTIADVGTVGINGWTVTNLNNAATKALAYPGAQTPYVNDGAHGSTHRFQYVNGVLTTTPLWPWPMNQRIIDGMLLAGRTPRNVENDIEFALGVSPDVNPAGTPPIDNYDSYTTSSDFNGAAGGSGGWTNPEICSSAGVMSIVVAPGTGQGGKSVSSNTAGGSLYCYRQFTGVSAGVFPFEMRTSINNPNDTTYGYSLYEANVSIRTWAHFGTAGYIEARDFLTSSWVQVCPYSINIFYRVYTEIDAVAHPNQYRMWCGLSGTKTAWIGTAGTLSVVNLSQFEDFVTVPHTFYWDATGSVTDLTTLTPVTGAQGDTIAATGTGTATVWVNGTTTCNLSPSTNITVNSTTVSDSTHLAFNFTIGAGAATGVRDVICTTGTAGETLYSGFTITPAGTPPVTPTGAGFRVRIRSRF